MIFDPGMFRGHYGRSEWTILISSYANIYGPHAFKSSLIGTLFSIYHPLKEQAALPERSYFMIFFANARTRTRVSSGSIEVSRPSSTNTRPSTMTVRTSRPVAEYTRWDSG
jgi:hypothetical protein